tara:strand:- start:25 stop:447 length:423 start_codon:yes stop_codon:yes gene_type:complete
VFSARLTSGPVVLRQTAHVCALNNVIQKLDQVEHAGANRHLVLPLELCPHAPEHFVTTSRRLDVVHNVHVNVVQVDQPLLPGVGVLVDDGAEDVASLGGRDLDVGPNRAQVQRSDVPGLGPAPSKEGAKRIEWKNKYVSL